MPVVLAYFNANLPETRRSSTPSPPLQAGGRWFEPSTAQSSNATKLPFPRNARLGLAPVRCLCRHTPTGPFWSPLKTTRGRHGRAEALSAKGQYDSGQSCVQ